ncbi:hypothetical protein ACTMQO_07350 [Escherichia coli]
MMSILRMANPAKLRARIISLGREYPVDQLINHVYLPVRQRRARSQHLPHYEQYV